MSKKILLAVFAWALSNIVYGGVYSISNEGKTIASITMRTDSNKISELDGQTQKIKLSVSTHMSVELIALPTDGTLVEALEIMVEHNIRHIPITKDGKLAGIVSDRDILFSMEKMGNSTKISKKFLGDIMTRELVAADRQISIGEAAHLMNFYKIDCLPIVSRDGILQGIITSTDLLAIICALDFEGAERGNFDHKQLDILADYFFEVEQDSASNHILASHQLILEIGDAFLVATQLLHV